jgi:hypothetical protein
MDFNSSTIKISLLILISLITISAQSQNNLFFDEVRLIRFSTQPSVTVPSGKVWKITGSDLEGTNASVNISIDGEPFFLSGMNTGVNNQIWLPEGTIVSAGTQFSNTANWRPTSTISIIQYSVIPIVSGTTGGSSTTGAIGVSSDGLVFEEAITLTLTKTSDIPAANASLFGEIVVPNDRILKINKVSTYYIYASQEIHIEGAQLVFIGDELFNPALSSNQPEQRLLPSGTYPVRLDYTGNGVPNRIVVNAILYSKP